jgi:hypothetical protein
VEEAFSEEMMRKRSSKFGSDEAKNEGIIFLGALFIFSTGSLD